MLQKSQVIYKINRAPLSLSPFGLGDGLHRESVDPAGGEGGAGALGFGSAARLSCLLAGAGRRRPHETQTGRFAAADFRAGRRQRRRAQILLGTDAVAAFGPRGQTGRPLHPNACRGRGGHHGRFVAKPALGGRFSRDFRAGRLPGRHSVLDCPDRGLSDDDGFAGRVAGDGALGAAQAADGVGALDGLLDALAGRPDQLASQTGLFLLGGRARPPQGLRPLHQAAALGLLQQFGPENGEGILRRWKKNVSVHNLIIFSALVEFT